MTCAHFSDCSEKAREEQKEQRIQRAWGGTNIENSVAAFFLNWKIFYQQLLWCVQLHTEYYNAPHILKFCTTKGSFMLHIFSALLPGRCIALMQGLHTCRFIKQIMFKIQSCWESFQPHYFCSDTFSTLHSVSLFEW